MMRRTGPTNIHLQNLIQELKKVSIESKAPLWKRVATDLEKPTRNRRVVNLNRLNRFTKKDETVIVPGKVLASGELDHPIVVSAFTCSQSALEKIQKAKGSFIPLRELLQKNPQGKNIRIMG